MFSLAWRALLAWALIIPIAILNGILRETLLSPALGSRIALPLSGILLALLILGLTWAALPRLGTINGRRCLVIGTGWLILTVAFEFGFGLYIAGKPWSQLLQAYDIFSGNLWPAVLATTAAAPWLMARLRGMI